jgi:mannitol dehydrogenase-like protein
LAHTHVHIGTGKFGLGMVLDMCKRAGFESIALNRNSGKKHHPVLLRDRSYRIEYDDDSSTSHAIDADFHFYHDESDREAIALLASPSVVLITTSVGPDGLKEVAPLLARAIEERRKNGGGPVCVMACENLKQNSKMLSEHIASHLSDPASVAYLRDSVGFCNTVVDRICSEIAVLPASVTTPAESFVEWIVEEPPTSLEAVERLNKGLGETFKRARSDAEFQILETRKYWCFNALHLAAAAYAYNYVSEAGLSLVSLSDVLKEDGLITRLKALQEELNLALRCFARKKGIGDFLTIEEMRRYNERILLRMQQNKRDRFRRILKHFEQSAKSEIDALKVLDLHEILGRVIERIIAPLKEILSVHEVERRRMEEMWQGSDIKMPPITRLQLDAALEEIVVALERYAREAYERTLADKKAAKEARAI